VFRRKDGCLGTLQLEQSRDALSDGDGMLAVGELSAGNGTGTAWYGMKAAGMA